MRRVASIAYKSYLKRSVTNTIEKKSHRKNNTSGVREAPKRCFASPFNPKTRMYAKIRSTIIFTRKYKTSRISLPPFLF